jgi:RND family efflux transporter MFP subunit
MRNKTLTIALTGLVIMLVNGCGKKEKPVEQIRSIKTMTVSAQATGQLRKFSGVVFAVNYSYLSFEDVSGRIIKLNVDIGDKVKKGDILAVVDKQKYQLDVKDAQAKLKEATAKLVKANADYEREKELFKHDASFQQRLDTRKFQYEAAISGKSSSKAALGLAERNLNHTELKSPYNGFVGERFIQSNQEVRKGEKIFRIDEKGALEVQFDVPENIRKRVKLNSEGTVRLAGHSESEDIKSKISFLGTAASKGNAFPAKARLENPPASVKPGMTAEISLLLPIKGGTAGFLIPPKAILMKEDKKTGYVFIYNPKTAKVKKTELKFKGSQGNLGIVADGLKDGDIIAVAGVAFLLDGMKVNLFKPKTETGE